MKPYPENETGENLPKLERMRTRDRALLQAKILEVVGFQRDDKTNHNEIRDWMSENAKNISEFIDGAEQDPETRGLIERVRELAEEVSIEEIEGESPEDRGVRKEAIQQERLKEAAELVVETLGLER